MNASLRQFALWVIIVLLLLAPFTLFQNSSPRNSATELSYSQFLAEVDSGRVREVVIRGNEIRWTNIPSVAEPFPLVELRRKSGENEGVGRASTAGIVDGGQEHDAAILSQPRW